MVLGGFLKTITLTKTNGVLYGGLGKWVLAFLSEATICSYYSLAETYFATIATPIKYAVTYAIQNEYVATIATQNRYVAIFRDRKILCDFMRQRVS